MRSQRIDLLRRQMLSGQLVLRDGWSDIPDSWTDRRRTAMAQDLFVFQEYFVKGRKIRDLAAEYDCNRTMIQFRIKRAVRFLNDYDLLAPATPGELVQPGK